MTPAPRLVVFDLDGTLVDSLPDIAASIARLRAAHGRGPRTADEVRAAIGAGSRILLERTCRDLYEGEAGFESLLGEFRRIYTAESVRAPRLYPGAAELLAATSGRALLAVLTNKPREITLPLLERLGIAGSFDRVVSPADARAVKPDPAPLRALLGELAVAASDALLVGDSVQDFAAGRAAGVFTVGMRGGYWQPGVPEPDRWVEDFAELGALLGYR